MLKERRKWRRVLNDLIKPYAMIESAQDDEELHEYRVIMVYNNNRYCVRGTVDMGMIIGLDTHVDIQDDVLFSIADTIINEMRGLYGKEEK